MRERARITDIYLAVGGLTGVGFVGPLLLVSVIRRQELQYYVYVLAHYPQARADTRFAEAVRQLSAHVNAAGEMVIDAPPRAWQGRSFARRGAPSELATRRWQQIQALLSQDQGP